MSDFGLIDAIESGLVKIPQLAVRDTTGAAIPGYFNIWQWILPQADPGRARRQAGQPQARGDPEVRATPRSPCWAACGSKTAQEWAEGRRRPAAAGLHPRLQEHGDRQGRLRVAGRGQGPAEHPAGRRSRASATATDAINTIRVDSKVVHETDTGEAKSDETRWMRFTLDTVGKTDWPTDRQGRPIYPEGFEELAEKLSRPLHPPGRDVRCIVSVGMLTEGWDCNTVTHIVGLRPFMSQLLCEQVVGRGLRRAQLRGGRRRQASPRRWRKVLRRAVRGDPVQGEPAGAAAAAGKRHHVHAHRRRRRRSRSSFPRVEGYTQAIRNRVTVDWPSRAGADRWTRASIPPEVEVKGLSVNNKGRLSLTGPGRVDDVTLTEFRASAGCRNWPSTWPGPDPRLCAAAAMRRAGPRPVPAAGADHPPVPRRARSRCSRRPTSRTCSCRPTTAGSSSVCWRRSGRTRRRARRRKCRATRASRGPGSTAEVDFWTSKDVREVTARHLNYVVADTRKWEQSAAYYIDTHPAVAAFVKNAGPGLRHPYLHNGQDHDYYPDFLIRLKSDPPMHLILETKGYDPLEDVKRAAAERWVAAVNADGSYGRWRYALVKKVPDVIKAIDGDLAKANATK